MSEDQPRSIATDTAQCTVHYRILRTVAALVVGAHSEIVLSRITTSEALGAKLYLGAPAHRPLPSGV